MVKQENEALKARIRELERNIGSASVSRRESMAGQGQAQQQQQQREVGVGESASSVGIGGGS